MIRHWTVLILSLATLTACGEQSGHGDPPTSSAAAAQSSFDQIEGEYPARVPGVPGAQSAPVGACVSLVGPQTNPSLKVVDCGSPENGYRVIQRVSTPDQCVQDADQRFYTNPEEGQWTACLDYAWSGKDCLSIGDMTAVRTACDGTAPHREMPVRLVVNTTTTADCPDGGFAHPVRRFTVCTQSQ